MTGQDQLTDPMPTRRGVLRTIAGLGALSLAGCLGGNEDDTDAVLADWRSSTIEDTTSGGTFRLADFEAPALVHTFASHCLTCANQQDELARFHERNPAVEIV